MRADDDGRDDMEDTFRSGPPSSLASKVKVDEEADTGEMLAAVEPEDVLDDAGPTAKTHAPKVPVQQVRVVERVRAKPPELPAAPKVETKRVEPRSAPKPVAPKVKRKLYNPFQVEDPPAVGVDPAVFPIHQSAPQTFLGQRIILGLVASLILLVMIAFMAGGSETPRQRAQREAREALAADGEIGSRRMKAEAKRQRAVNAAKTHPRGANGEEQIVRTEKVKRGKKRPQRQRPVAMIQPAERKAYQFSDGKVKQPRQYGDQSEDQAPPGMGPLLIVMSEPPALVFKDSKLFGTTPLLLPVDADTQKVDLTLRTFGYKDKSIEVKPAASGNLEASVVLEKDPAFEGFKVVSTEKPKDKS